MRRRKHDTVAIVEAISALNLGEKSDVICNKWGIGLSTLYRWHYLYNGMSIETVAWIEQLRYENAELKRKNKRLEYDIELVKEILNHGERDVQTRFMNVTRLLNNHNISVSRACKLIGLSRTIYLQKKCE